MADYANPLYGAGYDFPVWQGKARTVYLLCSTPRCGSTAFGMLLRQSATMGAPMEYFAPLNFALMRDRFGAAGEAETTAQIIAHRTSPSGVFGAKTHFDQLADTVRALSGHLGNELRYVRLIRRDINAQALSYARATKSNQWINVEGYHMAADRVPAADAIRQPEIDDFREVITRQNAAWDAYFHEHGASPLTVAYEDMLAHPNAVVGQVAAHLGVEAAPVDLAAIPLRIQRDEVGSPGLTQPA